MKLEPLFDRALDLEGEPRRRFLAELEQEDPAAYARLRRLVDAASSDDELLIDRPLREVAGQLAENVALEERVSPLREGDAVGDYSVVREISAGGMGRVFLAVRQVEPGGESEKVAIKVLRWSRQTQFASRFEREVRILGEITDSAIVPLLGSGFLGDGRPFFIMPYYEGLAITSYCSDKRLDLREKIELFSELCRAVGHAHAVGVTHRDLKPSNVLVESSVAGEPQLRVLDFGIARVHGAAESLTRTGQVVGTPGYMAPEQAAGDRGRVDQRADVFSLGVLLFEMVTGHPLVPNDFRGAVPDNSVAAIVSQLGAKVPAPEARRLSRILAGCLATEPEARYRLAGDLRSDVEAFLAGGKVSGVSYGSGSATRRGIRALPAAAVAAATVAGLLAVSWCGFSWYAARSDRLLSARADALVSRLRVARDTSPEDFRQMGQVVLGEISGWREEGGSSEFRQRSLAAAQGRVLFAMGDLRGALSFLEEAERSGDGRDLTVGNARRARTLLCIRDAAFTSLAAGSPNLGWLVRLVLQSCENDARVSAEVAEKGVIEALGRWTVGDGVGPLLAAARALEDSGGSDQPAAAWPGISAVEVHCWAAELGAGDSALPSSVSSNGATSSPECRTDADAAVDLLTTVCLARAGRAAALVTANPGRAGELANQALELARNAAATAPGDWAVSLCRALAHATLSLVDPDDLPQSRSAALFSFRQAAQASRVPQVAEYMALQFQTNALQFGAEGSRNLERERLQNEAAKYCRRFPAAPCSF